MHKLSYYIFYLKQILSGGPISDDFRWSDESLYFLLCNIRATLIDQKTNKRKFISDFNYQTIPSITLENTTIDDCDIIPDSLECHYKRSTIEIPEIVTHRNGYLGYVTDLFGNTIDIVSYKDNSNHKYTFTKKNNTVAFIINRKLYIKNNVDIEKCSITAVFYDPVQLATITCEGTETCYDPLEQPFPMARELADALFKLSYDDFVKYSMQVPADTTNNGTSPK